MTDGIAEEALHLTAAMQYCGSPSVVRTTWAMMEMDGRDLAKHFYGSMFPPEGQGVASYEKSAEALRDAVRRPRKKRVELEHWVKPRTLCGVIARSMVSLSRRPEWSDLLRALFESLSFTLEQGEKEGCSSKSSGASETRRK